MFRHALKRALVFGLVLTSTSVGLASATPGGGVVAAPILAVGTLESGVKIHTEDLKFSTRDDIQVVTQTITIAPGGHTGWHSHPGPVFVTIAAGTMTFYDADDPTCSPGTYPTGASFIDRGGGHVHIARNEGSVDMVLYATYLIPVGAGIRADAPNPGTCPF